MRLDKIAYLCVEILHRKYSERYMYNKILSIVCVSCQLKALFYFYSEVQPPLHFGSVSTRYERTRTSILYRTNRYRCRFCIIVRC